MWSIITSLFFSDWKSTLFTLVGGIIIVGLLFGAGFFIYDYNEKTALCEQYKSAADKWEANCKQAEQVNKENIENLAKLEKEAKLFQDLLKKRDEALQSINDEVKNRERRIATLERENDQVRTALNCSIPCELWREIFPSSSLCPDPNESSKAKRP